MYLEQCGDPYCPHKRRIAELEAELAVMRGRTAPAPKTTDWPKVLHFAGTLTEVTSTSFRREPVCGDADGYMTTAPHKVTCPKCREWLNGVEVEKGEGVGRAGDLSQ